MHAPRDAIAGDRSEMRSLRRSFSDLRPSRIVFGLGVAALVWPTMARVVTEGWSTEQGSHGPIVLMTGLWLLWRMWPHASQFVETPNLRRTMLVLIPLGALLIFSRIVQILEIEGFLMFGLLIAGVYGLIGARALRKLWFPLFYLAFIFPLPDTVIAFLTLPLKGFISRFAVDLLHAAGYPVGGAGVMIMIGQYELLVAAACSGLNSVVSLSVIGLFYLFVRHGGQWREALPSVAMIVPIAIAANLLRVMTLILLTYYGGEAVAQGFLHQLAGLFMFIVALALLIAWDAYCTPLFGRMWTKRA